MLALAPRSSFPLAARVCNLYIAISSDLAIQKLQGGIESFLQSRDGSHPIEMRFRASLQSENDSLQGIAMLEIPEVANQRLQRGTELWHVRL